MFEDIKIDSMLECFQSFIPKSGTKISQSKLTGVFFGN